MRGVTFNRLWTIIRLFGSGQNPSSKNYRFFMRNRRCDNLWLRHRWQSQRSKNVAFFDRTFTVFRHIASF
ncbi:hypothetical protein [Exercitatus varius]|uniref:hypothetical protein n=1 Tax=Exercitatus varius TaxID=67857 RepID=UPI00294B10CE|nr:hypothetical protein [Exercitatus varius]MDG2942227.1 hypothetical protein [Exercitatus varius]